MLEYIIGAILLYVLSFIWTVFFGEYPRYPGGGGY